MPLMDSGESSHTWITVSGNDVDSVYSQTYITATFENDAQLQKKIFDIFLEEMDPIKSLNGSLPAMVMQPITQSVIAQFSKNGGNALGLADAKGPLMRKFPLPHFHIPKHR